MSPAVVALIAASISSIGGIIAVSVNSRATTKTTVQSAVTKTLEEVWNQRVLFRDEQIADLREELSQQAIAHTEQIAALSGQVERLSAQVVKLGGVPHEQ